ncbi:MAG: cysteine desulfurase NifS [Firmicutes bacterium]|nr:cysteine desulfurase NifS [Bacillota bacterium]
MKVYLDHASTTPVDKNVMEKMLPYFSGIFGNASNLYSFGREAKKAVDISRQEVAKTLNCKDSEIYFTSGGTESDNFAIFGYCRQNKHKGNRIITTKIEHHGVLKVFKALEKEGFDVVYLDVNQDGILELETFKKVINDKTIFVSVMFANNEIGTIQPIKKIGELCKEKNIVFHTDAVQAIGAQKIDVKELNIDLLSLSAHKFYGPKGVGALYIKSGIKMERLIVGGAQERNMRGGTTNTPLIVGLGEAIRAARESIEKNNSHNIALRDRLIKRVLTEIPYSKLNGHSKMRLSNNANFSFEFIEGESILMMLDINGIAVATGSACSSGSLEPSHVLLACGVPIEVAHGSIRLTIGKSNTIEEIDFTVDTLKTVIEKLRKMSPLFKPQRGENIHV